MDFYQRLGMYFFTLGALLAILAGAFELTEPAYSGVLIALIFFGVFAAILNVGEDEELPFLAAASAFLIMIASLSIIDGNPIISALAGFFEVVTFFVGSMVAVVALRAVFEYASQGSGSPLDHASDVTDHVESLTFSKQERAWNFVVFLAVATTFIVVLLDVFFFPSEHSFVQYVFAFHLLITVLFAADLVVLYRKERSFSSFLKHCWLDIIATIPFYGALQVLKIARIFRLVRVIKLNKTLKLMSEKSGVKHYLRGDPSKGADKASAEQK